MRGIGSGWKLFKRGNNPLEPGEIAGWEVNSGENTGGPVILAEDQMVKRLKKIVRYGLLILTALVPLFFLPLTAPGDVLEANKQLLIYGFALVGLILWLAIIIRQGGATIRRSGVEIGQGQEVWLVNNALTGNGTDPKQGAKKEGMGSEGMGSGFVS